VRGQVKKQKTETQRTPFLLIHTAVSKDREAIFFFFFFLVFPDRVSLYSPGCPGTHFVDQAGLELKNPPASASQVLELKACTTMPGWKQSFNATRGTQVGLQ
jgi:hypothetical protein